MARILFTGFFFYEIKYHINKKITTKNGTTKINSI